MLARLLLLGPLLLVVAAGCSDRPKAPPLTNDTVYQNDAIGLRFRTPAGWPIASRAELPPGELAKPVVLASYLKKGGEKPADFQVMAADLSPQADPVQYLAEHRIGAETWTPQGAAAPVTVNGVEASRFVLVRSAGKDEVRREVTVFRRGGRAFFFVVSFHGADTASRDTIRASIDSITWTK